MNEQNAEQKQDAGTCGAGCDCEAPGPGARWRWIVGLIVLVAASALVARAMLKNNGVQTAPSSAGFAALPGSEQTSEPEATVTPVVPEASKEIAALSELNAVAGDTVGVFVFLPGKTEETATMPTAILEGAARTMEPQLRGGKIGIFTLRVDSQDYEQVASQTTVPGVLAMVKGGRMVPITGDITETKLIQGFVSASSEGGGCGPSGCGPRGCN